jgi:deoxyhypusine synthase
VSWGKFVAPQDGGKFAEVLCDATVAWPLLVKGVKERLDKKQVDDPPPPSGATTARG